jgi:small subunit ribosomal protein S10
MAPRPKGMMRLAQIKVQSYHQKFINDGCADILGSAAQMGLSTSGVIPLPTKRRLITIMKGPFVDRKALQQHHHSTHKRLIELYGASAVGQDATSTVHFLRYLEHTILRVPPGISCRVTLFSDEMAEPPPSAARSAVARAVLGDDDAPPLGQFQPAPLTEAAASDKN